MRLDVADLFKVSRELPISVVQLLRYYSEDIALGGECIRKIIVGESVKEYDIYISNKSGIEPADIIDYLEEYEQFLPYKVKFIIESFKNSYDLLNKMDFTVESAAISFSEGSWSPHCHERFYIDNVGKRIICLENVSGVSGLVKAMEYKIKGYSIDNDALSKILTESMLETELEYEEPIEEIESIYKEILDRVNAHE